ncbi:MAG TPA: R3H domain-containing nucleic acid-binding protein [Bryobacteraceae bacterium]|nr:R3H domain-containing nucleic acid-binding protein [Bryobacteraceae bacterium]
MTEKKYTVDSMGPRIDSFLKPVVRHAGFRVDYEVAEGEAANPDFENPEVVVRFSGADVDLLLANKAELLLALEYITMEALGLPSEDHSRLSFDAQDYRALRIEELRLSAATAAEKVKRTGIPFKFNPMNSRERRVIHLSLRNDTEVRSESTGHGGFRQVIIYPAGMASLPETAPPPYQSAGRPPGRGRPRMQGRGRP